MDIETNLYNYDDKFNLKLIKRLINNNINSENVPDLCTCIVDENLCIEDSNNCINVINLITLK